MLKGVTVSRGWACCVIVAALCVSACAATKNNRGDSASDPVSARVIEQLLAAQQFGDAIQALERDSRTGPNGDRQMLLKKANEQAANYDRATAASIREAVGKEDWRAAYRLMYEGAQRFPDGPLIRKSIEELTPRQNARVAELRVQLMIERANWILKSRPLMEELTYTDPSNASVSSELEQMRGEARQLAIRLSDLGVEALSEQKLDLAEKCLTKADELHPIAENILALERLDHMRHGLAQERRNERIREEQERSRAESEKRKQQRRAEEERVQQEMRKLSEEVRVAISKSELPRAQELMQRLRDADRNDPSITALNQVLDMAVTLRVNELLNRGNDLYGNGNIKDAREVWEEARRLSPENSQIRDRIHRADQVLTNLQDQQRRAPAGAATGTP